MKRIRRYGIAAAIVLLVVAVGAAVFRDEVRVWYCRHQMQKPDANPFYWMRQMVQAGPVGAVYVIDTCKDGSYDRDIEQISAHILMYADYDVFPYVSAVLSNPDPRARAYGALVAGYLRDRRYLPRLEELTKDEEALPVGWSDKTVGQRAETALHWIRNGIPVSEDFRQRITALTARPSE